jgi:hypothetical protein
MQIYRSTSYKFNPVSLYASDLGFWNDGDKTKHYEKMQEVNRTDNLDSVREQCHWFPFCPEDLRMMIECNIPCKVKFTVYLCSRSSSTKNGSNSDTCKNVVMNTNTVNLYNNVYKNQRYEDLVDFQTNMGEWTKFEYAWWLYCLNFNQRSHITSYINQDTNNVCLLRITIEKDE